MKCVTPICAVAIGAAKTRTARAIRATLVVGVRNVNGGGEVPGLAL
jgi:hypothetical protein